MFFKFIKIGFYLTVFVLGSRFSAIGYETGTLDLSIQEAIKIALKENLSLKSQTMGLTIDNLSIKQQESMYDPTLSLEVTRGESKRSNFTTYIPVSSVNSKTTNMNLQFGQKLSTGAQWGIGYYSSLSQSNIETEKNYSSNVGINLTQPLLNGFGKKVTESGIYMARLSEKMTRLDVENQASSLVYKVQSAYWNLYYAHETTSVMEMAVAQAESLLAYNEKAYALGLKTESEVLESKSAVISRKQEVINQKNTVVNYENELAQLLNLKRDNANISDINVTDKPDTSKYDISEQEYMEIAYKYRPDFISAETEIDKNQLQMNTAKNALLPSLDLVTSYKLNGSGNSYSNNMSDIGEADNYGWEVGLRMSYALGNNNSEASYEKTKVNKRKAELSLKDLKETIKYDINKAIREVRFQQSQKESMALSVQVNQRKLEKEQEKYRNNMSTSYMVLQYQKDLADARSQYHKALVDYELSLENLKLSSGTILRDHNINILTENQ